MNRRTALSWLAAAPVTIVTARAQQARAPRRVAFLMPFAETDRHVQRQLAAFKESFRQLGWVEGKNVRFDYRWAGSDLAVLRDYAKQIVALQPDVIVGRATPPIAALLRETRSIPIVFVVVSDPVGDGFVASLARPGGNITGFTNVESSLGGKWVELLKEIDPRVSLIGVMFDPKAAPHRGEFYFRLIERAANSLGLKPQTVPVANAAEIEQAIAAFDGQANAGLIVPPDITVANNRHTIARFAAKHRLPVVYGSTSFAEDGGLIAYAVEYTDLYRQAASYVDRILRGAKPAELPIQAPTAFELVVNEAAAKASGIAIPKSLLLRADRLIERPPSP